MPGLLNSLRSPSSPELLQKFFNARRSPPPERPQLSHRDTDILNDCIASTRTQIFELERRIKMLHANISTVCRYIKAKLPSFTPPIAVRLPEIFQGAAIPSPAEESPRKLPRKWPSLSLLRSHSPPNDTKLEIPASLVKRSADVPESEREIPSPTSISSENMALMTDSEAGVQVQPKLLVLKKAELEVEAAKLEADLVFWGNLYQQVRSVYRQEIDKEERRKSYFQTRIPSPPSLLRQWYFDADSIPSEHAEGRGTDTSRTFTIPRKEVPVREMLARVKASSLFLSRSGTSREYS